MERYLDDMKRRFLLLILAFAVLPCAACAGQSVRQPAKPPPPAEPRTRLEQPGDEDQPKLIAPPPAYGNKVVMAKAGGSHGL